MSPPCPVALFVVEPTLHGTWYHPANRLAIDLCAFGGCAKVRLDRLKHLAASGIKVAEPNGLPIDLAGAA